MQYSRMIHHEHLGTLSKGILITCTASRCTVIVNGPILDIINYFRFEATVEDDNFLIFQMVSYIIELRLR
jgi:hypothetical protein